MAIYLAFVARKPVFFITLIFLCLASGVQAAGDYATQRRDMVKEIAELAKATGSETGRDTFAPAVMAAMSEVPRHEFVPRTEIRHAYENRPLGIGHGQTISQPYIVALMTDLLDVGPESVALEIGTGSAYQAAVLAELVKKVYTIEIIEPLAGQAKRRLATLGYGNVETRLGDGYHGWETHAPFDAIIVTAAADHVPPPLVRQLKPGGRMVIPVGGRFLIQYLMLVEKDLRGAVSSRQILPVRFVPFTGEHR